MIALPRAVATRETLRALGYPVQWHEYPMEHSVCLPEIADLQQFLLEVLKR
jgi:phospholipase/carboxylesterase